MSLSQVFFLIWSTSLAKSNFRGRCRMLPFIIPPAWRTHSKRQGRRGQGWRGSSQGASRRVLLFYGGLCLASSWGEGEGTLSTHVGSAFSVVTYLVLVYLVLALHKRFLGSDKGQEPIIRLRGNETPKDKERGSAALVFKNCKLKSRIKLPFGAY